jgi:hypothetical protein
VFFVVVLDFHPKTSEVEAQRGRFPPTPPTLQYHHLDSSLLLLGEKQILHPLCALPSSVNSGCVRSEVSWVHFLLPHSCHSPQSLPSVLNRNLTLEEETVVS